jgi:hypothetical protein
MATGLCGSLRCDVCSSTGLVSLGRQGFKPPILLLLFCSALVRRLLISVYWTCPCISRLKDMRQQTTCYLYITSCFFQFILSLLYHPRYLQTYIFIPRLIDLALLLSQNKRTVKTSPFAKIHHSSKPFIPSPVPDAGEQLSFSPTSSLLAEVAGHDTILVSTLSLVIKALSVSLS